MGAFTIRVILRCEIWLNCKMSSTAKPDRLKEDVGSLMKNLEQTWTKEMFWSSQQGFQSFICIHPEFFLYILLKIDFGTVTTSESCVTLKLRMRSLKHGYDMIEERQKLKYLRLVFLMSIITSLLTKVSTYANCSRSLSSSTLTMSFLSCSIS